VILFALLIADVSTDPKPVGAFKHRCPEPGIARLPPSQKKPRISGALKRDYVCAQKPPRFFLTCIFLCLVLLEKHQTKNCEAKTLKFTRCLSGDYIAALLIHWR